MFNFEEEIEKYAHPMYKPQQHAADFFASHDMEQVKAKLNEMTGIQVNVSALFSCRMTKLK